jgi:hypothetical protein
MKNMVNLNTDILQKSRFCWLLVTLLISFILCNIPPRCQAQYNNSDQTVLVVKRYIMPSNLTDSLRAVFKIGDKLKVVDINGNMLMGPVTKINDTMLTIKNQEMRISQIKSIRRANGIITSIVGSSIALTSLSVFFTIYGIQSGNEGYGNNIIGVVMIDILVGIVGFIPAMIGIIQVASYKHFIIGKKWKMTTLPLKVIKDRF